MFFFNTIIDYDLLTNFFYNYLILLLFIFVLYLLKYFFISYTPS